MVKSYLMFGLTPSCWCLLNHRGHGLMLKTHVSMKKIDGWIPYHGQIQIGPYSEWNMPWNPSVSKWNGCFCDPITLLVENTTFANQPDHPFPIISWPKIGESQVLETNPNQLRHNFCFSAQNVGGQIPSFYKFLMLKPYWPMFNGQIRHAYPFFMSFGGWSVVYPLVI